MLWAMAGPPVVSIQEGTNMRDEKRRYEKPAIKLSVYYADFYSGAKMGSLWGPPWAQPWTKSGPLSIATPEKDLASRESSEED